MRIDVYDAKNPERLLGSLPKPTTHSPVFHIAVLPRLQPVYEYKINEALDLRLDKITLERHAIYSNGGWDVEIAAITRTPLEILLRHPDFRLPGESEYGAEIRRRYIG